MSDFPPTNTGSGLGSGPDGAFERFLSAALATIITIMFSWRMLLENENADEQQTYENLRRQILQRQQQHQAGSNNNNGGAGSNAGPPNANGSVVSRSAVSDQASRHQVSLLARAGAISSSIRASNVTLTSASGPQSLNRDTRNDVHEPSNKLKKTGHENTSYSLSPSNEPPEANEVAKFVELSSSHANLVAAQRSSVVNTERLRSLAACPDGDSVDILQERNDGFGLQRPLDSLVDSGYYDSATGLENTGGIRDDISLDGLDDDDDDGGDGKEEEDVSDKINHGRIRRDLADSGCHGALLSNEVSDVDNTKPPADDSEPVTSWGEYDWEEDAYSRVNTRRSPREFTSVARTKSDSSGSDQSYTAVSDYSDNEISEGIPHGEGIPGDTYSNREYRSIVGNEDYATMMSQNTEIPDRTFPKTEISDSSESDSSSTESDDYGDFEPEGMDSEEDANPEGLSPLEPIIEEDSDDDIDDNVDVETNSSTPGTERIIDKPIPGSNPEFIHLDSSLESRSKENNNKGDKCDNCHEVDRSGAECFVNNANSGDKNVNCDDTASNMGHSTHSSPSSIHLPNDTETFHGTNEARPGLLNPKQGAADDLQRQCFNSFSYSDDGVLAEEVNKSTGCNLADDRRARDSEENASFVETSRGSFNQDGNISRTSDSPNEEKLDTTSDKNSAEMFTSKQLLLEADDGGQRSISNDSTPEAGLVNKSHILAAESDRQDKESLLTSAGSPPNSPLRTCALDDLGGYISDESCSSGSVVTCVSVRSYDGEGNNTNEVEVFHDQAWNTPAPGELTPERLGSSDENCSDSDECLEETSSNVTKSDSVIHIPDVVDTLNCLPPPGGKESPVDVIDNSEHKPSVSERQNDMGDFSYCDFVNELHTSSTSEGALCDENSVDYVYVDEKDKYVSIDTSHINDAVLPSERNDLSASVPGSAKFDSNSDDYDDDDNDIINDVLNDLDRAYGSDDDVDEEANDEDKTNQINEDDYLDENDGVLLHDNHNDRIVNNVNCELEGNEIDGTFYITSNILHEEPVYTDSDDDDNDDDSEGPREYNPYDDDFADFDEDDEDSFFMFVREEDNKIKKLETVTNLNDLGLNRPNDGYNVEKRDDGTVIFTKTQELQTDHHVRLYAKDRTDIPEFIHEERETNNDSSHGVPGGDDVTDVDELVGKDAENSFLSNSCVLNGDMYSIAEEEEEEEEREEEEKEEICEEIRENNVDDEKTKVEDKERSDDDNDDSVLCKSVQCKSKVPNLDLAAYLISEKHKSPPCKPLEPNNFDFKSSEDSLSAELSQSSESLPGDIRIAEDNDSGIQCSSTSPSETSNKEPQNEEKLSGFSEECEEKISDANHVTKSENISCLKPVMPESKTQSVAYTENEPNEPNQPSSSFDLSDNRDTDLKNETRDPLRESNHLSMNPNKLQQPDVAIAMECNSDAISADDTNTMDALESALKPCLDKYAKTVDRQNSQEYDETYPETKPVPKIVFSQGQVVRKSVVKPSTIVSPARGVKAKIGRSLSQKVYKSVLTEPILVTETSPSLLSPTASPLGDSKHIPLSRQKIMSSRQRFLSADDVSQDQLSPKFEQFKIMSTSNTSLPRPRLYTPKRDHSTRSLRSLNFDRPDYVTTRIASRSSQSDDSYEKPEIDHLHQNCIFSPHKHEEIISLNESIENLHMREQLLRYASVSSLMETDLDTGETIETRILTDFDVFALQHEPLQRTASLGDIVHKMREDKKPSSGSGRFANRTRPKSKSLMTLETDIDEACTAVGEGNLQRTPSVHEIRVAKSLQKLNVPDWYKKSSVSRSGSTYSLFERRDSTSTINSIGYAPSVISSPLPSMSPTNTPVVIKTRVTPSAARLLRSPKLPITPEKSPIPITSFQLPSHRLRQRDKGREPMPVPIVPFCQLRKMFENKSSDAPNGAPKSPTATVAPIPTSPTSPSSTTTTTHVQKTPSLKIPDRPTLAISPHEEISPSGASSPRSPASPSEPKKVSFEGDVKPVVKVQPLDTAPVRAQPEETVKNGKLNKESHKNRPPVPEKPRKDKEKGSPKKSDESSPKKGFFSGGLRMPRLGRSSKSSHSKVETIIDHQPIEEKTNIVVEPTTVEPAPPPDKNRKAITETTV